MAVKASYSKPTIQRLRQNMRCYNDTKAPLTRVGRRRSMTPHILDALREKLLADAGLYQDKMARFVHNEFGIQVSQASISRALNSIK
jgi:hypothetical protein